MISKTFVILSFIFIAARKVNTFECSCPSPDTFTLEDGLSREIDSQPAGCNFDCSVIVQSYNSYSGISFNVQKPTEIDVQITDDRGTSVPTNCGMQCYSNSSKLNITFIPSSKPDNVNGIARVNVESVQFTTTTWSTSTPWYWSSSSRSNNAFLVQNFEITVFVLMFVKILSFFH